MAPTVNLKIDAIDHSEDAIPCTLEKMKNTIQKDMSFELKVLNFDDKELVHLSLDYTQQQKCLDRCDGNICRDGSSVLAADVLRFLLVLKYLDLSVSSIGPDSTANQACRSISLTSLQCLDLLNSYINSDGTSAYWTDVEI